MKKLKDYIHLLVPVILYLPYRFLNSMFFVKLLGCGCPVVDEKGDLIENSFNTNDFTILFWSIIALILVVYSVFRSKKVNGKAEKLKYLTITISLSALITLLFYFLIPVWE